MISETRPVWSAGTITALVTAVLALLVAFGVPITDEQKMAVIGLIGVVAPFAAAALSAPKVTPRLDPKDEDGTPLVRADNAPTQAQVRSMTKP